MRLLLLLENAIANAVSDSADALVTPDGGSRVYSWEVNPNIALGSLLHLERLHSLFDIASSQDAFLQSLTDVGIFRVVWAAPTATTANAPSSSWKCGAYVDPSRSAYDLSLKEDSCLYITHNPIGVFLSQNLQRMATSSSQKGSASSSSSSGAVVVAVDDIINKHLIIPLPTAALRFFGGGDDVHVMGPSSRRAWKRRGNDAEFSREAAAMACFPKSTLASATSSSSRLRNQDSQQNILRWSFRLGYRDPYGKRTGDKKWPVMPGDEYFVDNSSSTGGGSSERSGVVGRRKASIIETNNHHDDDDEHDSEGGAGRGDDEEEAEDEEEVTPIGMPLPRMLLGFAVTDRFEDWMDGAAAGDQAKSNPLHECVGLEHAVCVFDSLCGTLHLGGEPRGPVAVADIEAYAPTLGTTITFAVDLKQGLVNLFQDGHVLCVTSLPTTFVEVLSASTYNDGSDAISLESVSPVVHIATLGGAVDIF